MNNSRQPKPRSRNYKDERNNKREYVKIREMEEYFKKNILKITSLKYEYDIYIENAKAYAENLRNLSTSQIRKVYSDIINAESAMELKRLRPKLAYIQGRNPGNNGIKSFLGILDKGLEELNPDSNEEEIKSLKEFAQTIVAYRKYFGDRN